MYVLNQCHARLPVLISAVLCRECAGLDADGDPRPPKDVAMSLQMYLMAAILTSIPDRQGSCAFDLHMHLSVWHAYQQS